MGKILDVDFKNKTLNLTYETVNRDTIIVDMDKSFCNILKNMQALGLEEKLLRKIHDQFCIIAYFTIKRTK